MNLQQPLYKAGLALGFWLAFAFSLPAQYLVGSCSGATHSTLQAAFNDVAATTISGTFVIEICSGTYTDQQATLGALTYGSGGGNVIVKKAASTTGAVTLVANSPAVKFLIKLDGSQNVDIRNLTLQVNSDPSRNIYRMLTLTNGAGEVNVKNCTFTGYNIPSGYNHSSASVFSGIYAEDRDGDLTVTGSTFNKGGIGMYSERILSTAADSDLWISDNSFTNHKFGGARVEEGVDSIQFNDNEVSTTVAADLAWGIEVVNTSTSFQAHGNQISASNKDAFTGLKDESRFQDIQYNDIEGADISKQFNGIYVSGFTTEGSFKHNDIVYAPSPAGEGNDSSAVGIFFRGDYSAIASLPGTQWVEIDNNDIALDAYKHSCGIWIEGKGTAFQDHLYIQDNKIDLNGTKSLMYSSTAKGVYIQGNGSDALATRIEDNRITGTFGVSPIFHGMLLDNMGLTGTMVVLNNKVESDGARPFSGGISMTDIGASFGNNHFVGNNTVSLPGIPGSLYGMRATDVSRMKFHHNSINLHSGSSSGPIQSVAFALLTNDPANCIKNDLWNNIFSHPSGGRAIEIANPGSIKVHDYNLLYSGSGSELGAFNGSIAYSLSDWQSLSSDAANSLQGDPLFSSTTNLHILLLSPARGSAIPRFYPTYASALIRDFEGDWRGTAGNREIGADEIGRGGNKQTSPSLGFAVYPNPSQGKLNLNLPGDGNWNIQLLDLNGRSVLSSEGVGQVKFDLSQLPKGLYLVQISNSTKHYQKKLMLQ